MRVFPAGLAAVTLVLWAVLFEFTAAAFSQEADSSVLPPLEVGSPLPAGLTERDFPPQPVEQVKAPHGAPNVVIVLLDDVGFGAAGTFGGPIPTPDMDRLAAQGLRYNRFHTTSICSPTRASLLTGRNSHAVSVGHVLNSAAPYPGYDGVMPKSAATIAEILRQHGYSTSLWGKWHLTPEWETSAAGPFDRWPTRMGFEKFYGFLPGETHQFQPTLYDGTTLVESRRPADYHLTEDLAEQAVQWMRLQHSLDPQKPFFVYFAPGATHAPLHVPKPWIERFAGRFDQGWDEFRKSIFARQKELGIIPASTELTPRPKEIPAWQELSADQKKIAARLMEVYAGFLAHTDAQIGKLVTGLNEIGEFENTLFFYIVGDNGGSGEGGLFGSRSYMGALQGAQEETSSVLAHLEEIGGPSSYPHYPAGWAWAMDTPFQWMKQIASHLGGTRNPLVVTWPGHIRDRGGLRSQFSHVNDIMPTILEAAGIPAPASVNGVQQQPIDGVSLLYSFDDANAAERHRTQYFEVFGNRALYHDGWMVSAFHGRVPWMVLQRDTRAFSEDPWELYDLRADFSQAHNLAEEKPEKLAELKELFWAEFARNNGLPLHAGGSPQGMPRLNPPERTKFTYYPGAMGIPESAAPRVVNRSHVVTAEVTTVASGTQGVLVAEGGVAGGWSLYVTEEGKPFYTYNYFGLQRTAIAAKERLPSGDATVQVQFAYDGGGWGKGATAKLLVDGKLAGEARIVRTTPYVFSIDESFDVGTDTGSPVGDYPPDYDFTGTVRKVTIELK